MQESSLSFVIYEHKSKLLNWMKYGKANIDTDRNPRILGLLYERLRFCSNHHEEFSTSEFLIHIHGNIFINMFFKHKGGIFLDENLNCFINNEKRIYIWFFLNALLRIKYKCVLVEGYFIWAKCLSKTIYSSIILDVYP